VGFLGECFIKCNRVEKIGGSFAFYIAAKGKKKGEMGERKEAKWVGIRAPRSQPYKKNEFRRPERPRSRRTIKKPVGTLNALPDRERNKEARLNIRV